ncbi:ATP-dependent DNA ligase LigA [Haloparvum sp. PAK95]|uniref:ATP-dependent DNA ligase LigA n=1 Tax=Haloparvum sp. PAK95 TaxID=3418962 RepID=UPI003D2F259A
MEFAEFAARAETIEAEPGDLETTALVAALFDDADEALPTVVRFLLGRVFPAHDTRTLDIGPSLCQEAIARAAGQNVDADDVEDRLAERGEIGAVAAGYEFGGQQGLGAFAGGTDALTVAEVDETLRELAAASGAGSESTKLDTLFGLFNRSEPTEAKLLARLVLGEMRLGVGEGAVRDAIAEAFLADAKQAGEGDPATEAAEAAEATLEQFAVEGEDADADDAVDADAAADADADADAGAVADAAADAEADAEVTLHASDADVAAVERALQVTNDYGHVAILARDEGREGLDSEGLQVGRPVQAMLAQAGTASDAMDEWDAAGVETKFDGARVQIHYAPGDQASSVSEAGRNPLEPRIYSRNMDDVTAALPEIGEFVADAVDVPVILDGEVVAVDDAGDPLPFQEVLRRFRRKHDVERMRDEVELRLHAFDCLHVAGDDLLDAPLVERHDRLADVVPDAAADLDVVETVDAIAERETAALEAGHEGIMLKDPHAAYTPGDRGRNWLKRKPDVETLDLVVTGAEWGEGRRANLLGTFLLGVRDDEGDGYETIGKVATGITDEELEDLTELLEPYIASEDGTEVDLQPEVVFEVGYEEIQRSPTYSSGYALRFPRYVERREDKDPSDADTLARVERLADQQ